MKTVTDFLNEKQQVVRWPKKAQERQEILRFLASKFYEGRIYHEREVNELLKEWHTFQDWSGLRRELIIGGYLKRNTDGTAYEKPPRE